MSTQAATTVELELTYLAKEIPKEILVSKPILLTDIYIPDIQEKHSKLRLRQKGGYFTITKKIQMNPGDASAHNELTIPLDEDEFKALASCSNKKVIKDRYKVTIEGLAAEVDVFRDSLSGLIVIDFEFDNELDKSNFTPPACCLFDVTQEDFIAGGNLAGKNYSDLQSKLSKFNYKKLLIG